MTTPLILVVSFLIIAYTHVTLVCEDRHCELQNCEKYIQKFAVNFRTAKDLNLQYGTNMNMN